MVQYELFFRSGINVVKKVSISVHRMGLMALSLAFFWGYKMHLKIKSP